MSAKKAPATSFNAFAATGAELRARAAAGCAASQAEIARRAAKPAKTVAALRSRGEFAQADARVQAAQKAPAFAYAKAVPEPGDFSSAGMVRYTEHARAERLARKAKPAAAAAPAPEKAPAKRDTLKAVRADLGGRMDRIEGTLANLAQSTEKLLGCVKELVARR